MTAIDLVWNFNTLSTRSHTNFSTSFSFIAILREGLMGNFNLVLYRDARPFDERKRGILGQTWREDGEGTSRTFWRMWSDVRTAQYYVWYSVQGSKIYHVQNSGGDLQRTLDTAHKTLRHAIDGPCIFFLRSKKCRGLTKCFILGCNPEFCSMAVGKYEIRSSRQ